MTSVIRLDYRSPRTKEEKDMYGMTYKHEDGVYEIFINRKKQAFNHPETLRTLVHEFVHLAMMIRGMKMRRSAEEGICRFMEDTLTALLTYTR